MKLILIDPIITEIRFVEAEPNLATLQELVGGFIEIAHEFENGDTLYVCEDGLENYMNAVKGRGDLNAAAFFDIGAHQPFAGRGVIVGAEDAGGAHTAPKTSIAYVRENVVFMLPQAIAADSSGRTN